MANSQIIDGNTITTGVTIKVSGKWLTVTKITADKVHGFVKRRAVGIYNQTKSVSHDRAKLLADGFKFED